MTEQKTQQKSQSPDQQPAKKEKQPVNPKVYEAFVDLHFMKLDGATLKDSAEKEYQQLKKEVESCNGHKPKKDRTCSFKSGTIKLAKGIPVPDEVYKVIKAEAKDLSFYF